MTPSFKPASPSQEVVGRDTELAIVAQFLGAIRKEPRALLLTGAAGMGKTTILRWAQAEAERTGSRVLLARPGEDESQLAFAGLADLLGSVDTAGVAGLPDVQRHARDAALRREEGDPLVDPLAIGHATLGIVRALSDGATAAGRPRRPVARCADGSCPGVRRPSTGSRINRAHRERA